MSTTRAGAGIFCLQLVGAGGVGSCANVASLIMQTGPAQLHVGTTLFEGRMLPVLAISSLLVPRIPPGAPWLAALNAPHTVDVTEGNVQLRLRVGWINDGGVTGATAYKWQYAHNGGTWTDLTASSSPVKTFATSDYTDGDDVPQLITGGSYQADNNAAEASTGAVTLTAALAVNTSVESEVALDIIAADVDDTDTLAFRIVHADGTAFEAYDETPSLSVVKSGEPPPTGIVRQMVLQGLYVSSTSGG